MHRLVKPAILCSLAVVVICGCASQRSAIDDRRVIGEAIAGSEFKENLRALCLDGGRLSGSENGRKAEEYVAAKLRKYGLTSVHFEPFEMSGWRVNETVVTALTDPPLTLINAVALGNTLSTPAEGIEGELIDVGEGRDEDFERSANAIHGKFVLVSGGKSNRREKMAAAGKCGALGVLYVGAKDREPVIGGCHADPRPEPAIAIRYSDGEKLAELLTAGESVRLNVKVKTDIWDAKPRNVVGEIHGDGPLAHEVVMIGAHLDSWHLAEGAIDNGNGATTVLETARTLAALHKEGWRPRRTIRFAWYMGEEQGLFGSKAYVAQHAGELDDLVVVINLDMPGEPRSFTIFGHPEFEKFLASVAGDLPGYELTCSVADSKGEWSDHAPFQYAGVCTVSINGDLGDGVKNYHTVDDKYECVDRRGTIHSAAVAAVLLQNLADCPKRPTQRRPAIESD